MFQKLGVGALIFDKKGRILLQYRTKFCEFYPDCWFLPCGKAEDNEGPIEAIIREVKEETSLEIEVVREVYNKLNEKGIQKIAYECKILKGSAKNMEPHKFKDIRYFPLDNLPSNTGKITLEIIEKYKKISTKY